MFTAAGKCASSFPSNFTYTNYATTTTSSITIPADAKIGDIAFLFDTPVNSTSTAPSNVVPSGWTQIYTGFGGTVDASRQTVSYKILQSGDAGSSITGMTGESFRKAMLVFTPDQPINSVNFSTPSIEITDGNPAQQSLSMAGNTAPLLGFAVYRCSNNPVSPRTSSLTMNEIEVITAFYIKYIIYNFGDTPQDGTVDMNDNGGTNGLSSFFAVFK